MLNQTFSTPQVDISIVIVSWNVSDRLMRCIGTIVASTTVISRLTPNVARNGARPFAEIILVDSNSSDDTVARVSALECVKVIECDENVGYGRGNNIGLRSAIGKYVLFLNPDTEIVDDAITMLWRFMEAHPEVAVTGPGIRREDGMPHLLPQLLPSLLGTLFEASLLVKFTPTSILKRECVFAPAAGHIEVEWVLGASLMIPRHLLHELGGFDEEFVLYSEEKDLCARAGSLGYKICLVGDAKVIHLGGKSTEQLPVVLHRIFWESHILYFRKHKTRTASEVLRYVAVLNYAFESIVWLVKLIAKPKSEPTRKMLRLYRQTAYQLATRSVSPKLPSADE
jgi:N-acetylglucosaminyl-diphospho-decaprenol L-rhamnosyltransferase